MAELKADSKTLNDLFRDKRSNFLIPDYQRPYSWAYDKECKILWEDLLSFAFPEGNASNFDFDEYYFLGPVVVYKNGNMLEIIDGQQRLTTILLMFRAFYDILAQQQGDRCRRIRKRIGLCLWKANEFEECCTDSPKLTSQVATDEDRHELDKILREGSYRDAGKETKDIRNRYAQNFSFFKERISELTKTHADDLASFPARIIDNCVLLPIQAESQDTALRIFHTLNDRGMPLSDADIFKSQLYKFYKNRGNKDFFIKEWKELEAIANKTFRPKTGTPLDELFTRYMYYERAKRDIKSSTTEGLRKFYEKNDYEILKGEQTMSNLKNLAIFWQDVCNQDTERFSDNTLKKLFILEYAPNGMWTYIVSVYFMTYHDIEGRLEEDKFNQFLDKITAFIWAYALTNPGVNSLRTPMYAEMLNIVNSNELSLADYLFDEKLFRSIFSNFEFKNGRSVTKSYLIWWAFSFNDQILLPIETSYDIEHIYPTSRNKTHPVSKDYRVIDLLGNKAILERRINIRASDYRLCDKKRYYHGSKDVKSPKRGTDNMELLHLTEVLNDFKEVDILNRNRCILDGFINFLSNNNLLKKEEVR